jgi:hypothetical protein
MWPHDKMPNPVAGKRLTDLGCKVLYQKSHLLEPRKIRTHEDLRPGAKKGKLDRKPIWIVEVQMPKQIAFDIYKGYMDKMKNESGTEEMKDQQIAPANGPGAPAPVAPPAPGTAPAPGSAPAPAATAGATSPGMPV